MIQDFREAIIQSGGGDVGCHNISINNIVLNIRSLRHSVEHLESTSDAAAHPSRIECKKLAAHATAVLDKIDVGAASYTSLGAVDHLERTERAMVELVSVLGDLTTQPKLKNILWRKYIADRIDKMYQHLSAAVQIFDLGTHTNLGRFQQEREQARRSDTEQFRTALRSLDRNTQKIIEFLGVETADMPEAIVALQKHLVSINNSPEKLILEQGMHAMQRISHHTRSAPDPFVITSLDVVVYRDKRLGRGGFADAFEGTWRGTIVAVKMLSKEVPPRVFQHEVDIWKQLRHPNILECFGACSIADPPFFVCALKSNRDAIDYLRRQPTADRTKLLHETSLGLQYLHSNFVIHGDIKGTNILIDEHGTASLCDFGLSRIKLHTSAILSTPSHPSGTLQWMSPEQLSSGKISKASDVYSFGVTIYEIFTGDPPFAYMPSDLIRINVVDNKSRPMRPTDKAAIERGLDDALWALAEGCWSHEPVARPTADFVATHLHSIHSIQLTSLRAEPVSSTDESSSAQGTPTPSHRETDGVFTDQNIITPIMGPTGTGTSSFINTAIQQDLAVVGHDVESYTGEQSQPLIVIALIGPAGSGRSSFVDKLTAGRGGEAGNGLSQQTTRVEKIEHRCPARSDFDILLIDTPALELGRSDPIVLSKISDKLPTDYRQNNLSGLLYFHRILGELGGAPSPMNVAMFKSWCGEDDLRNIILTSTMWDELDDERAGVQLENQLRSSRWRDMLAHGASVKRHWHTSQSAWAIIDPFLEDANAQYASFLQVELDDLRAQVSRGKEGGTALFETLEMLLQERGGIRHQIRRETRRGADDKVSAALAEYEDCRNELSITIKEMQKLELKPGRNLLHLVR